MAGTENDSSQRMLIGTLEQLLDLPAVGLRPALDHACRSRFRFELPLEQTASTAP